jgi:hypothetical protein
MTGEWLPEEALAQLPQDFVARQLDMLAEADRLDQEAETAETTGQYDAADDLWAAATVLREIASEALMAATEEAEYATSSGQTMSSDYEQEPDEGSLERRLAQIGQDWLGFDPSGALQALRDRLSDPHFVRATLPVVIAHAGHEDALVQELYLQTPGFRGPEWPEVPGVYVRIVPDVSTGGRKRLWADSIGNRYDVAGVLSRGPQALPQRALVHALRLEVESAARAFGMLPEDVSRRDDRFVETMVVEAYRAEQRRLHKAEMRRLAMTTRRNGIPIHHQPALFGGPDSAHLADWKSATPLEIRHAAATGHLTDLDLQEMRALLAEVQADGTLEPMLSAGVSRALAYALVDGFIEEVEIYVLPDDVRRLHDFLEHGTTLVEFHQLAKEFANRGFHVYHGMDLDRWVAGPIYRWTHAVVPTFNDEGTWTGEAMYLIAVSMDPVDGRVAAKSASALGDEISMGQTDPEDYIDTSFVDYTHFWNGPCPLYHATQAENVDSIIADGLGATNESRGLRNRSVGAAVFTTTELEQAFDGVYGDVVFEIDTTAMKRDGYMPRVHAEPDVVEAEAANSLMSALGEEDFHMESENDPRTAIILGSIPPKYLRIVEE